MERAYNPQTNEYVFLVDNEWVKPTQEATNPKTGERAFLVNNQWEIVPGQKPAQTQPVASTAPAATPAPAPAQEPAEPAPYKNRLEALDDAVNLLEEGAPKEKLIPAFQQMGISWDEITKHGQARGSDFFKTQPAIAAAPAIRKRMAPGEMKATEPGMIEGAVNLFKRVDANVSDAATGFLFQTGGISPETAGSVLAQTAKRRAAAMPDSETRKGMEAIADAKTYGDAAMQLAKNPAATFTMLAESVLTTIPMTAPALVLGPAGALVRAGAQGLASGTMEYASVLTDVLQDAGVDLLDPNAVAKALSDPKIVEQAKEKGAKRGLIVGTFDALTMGLAGRFMKPAQTLIAEGKLAGNAAKKATVAAWGKELAMQAAGGAGGEFAAQKATGENKPSEVLLEAGAEMFTAPLDVRANLREAKQLERAAALQPAKTIQERVEPTLEEEAPAAPSVQERTEPKMTPPSTVQADEAQEVEAITQELIAQNFPADNARRIAKKRVAENRKQRIADLIAEPSDDPVAIRAKEYIDAGMDPVEAINRARVDVFQSEDLGVQDVSTEGPAAQTQEPGVAGTQLAGETQVPARPVEPAGGVSVPVVEQPGAVTVPEGAGRAEPSGVDATGKPAGKPATGKAEQPGALTQKQAAPLEIDSREAYAERTKDDPNAPPYEDTEARLNRVADRYEQAGMPEKAAKMREYAANRYRDVGTTAEREVEQEQELASKKAPAAEASEVSAPNDAWIENFLTRQELLAKAEAIGKESEKLLDEFHSLPPSQQHDSPLRQRRADLDAQHDEILNQIDALDAARKTLDAARKTAPAAEAPKGKRGRPAALTEEERKQKREASKPAQAAKARADRAVKRLEATINETAKPLENTEFDSDADRIAAKREAIKELMQLKADPNLRGTKVAERIKKALEHPSITQQERADIQKGLDVLKQRQDASSAKRAQAPVDNTFSKFTTAKQAIDHIIKTGNKVQRAFARRLKNFVKGVEFVVIEKGQELPPALAKHAAQWERSVGLFIENYDTGARAIFVRGESFGADQGINNVTVLHELFHAATNRKIALAEEAVVSGKIDTELVNAYKMLLRTMRNAQNAFAEASSEGSLSTDVADLYSSTEGLVIADPREFLAYGLTDEGMQDFLAAAEGFAEEPSLFSNFVRSLRMFFGFPKSEHNALTNLISATDAILRSKAPRVAVSGEEASSSVIPPDEDQYGNPIRSAKKLARDQKVARRKVEASREGELLSATEQLAKSRSAEDVLSVLKGLLARNWQNMSHDAIDKLVRMPTMTFLADWSGINALKDADTQMQKMTGMANALTASAYEVRRMLAKDLNPLFRSAKKFREDFENLVYESTITRYDPSNPKNKVRNKALDTMWSNIGEKGRRMYKMLQKHYENLIDLYSDLLDQQIENLQGLNPEAKQNLMAMLRSKFESSARITPYFPLVRYGDYWLRVDKGDFKGFYMFESVGDRNAFRQQVADQMREDSADEGIFESNDTVRSLRFGTQANSEMLKAIFDAIDNENFGEGGAEAKEALKDSIYQIYLQTMPEQKFRDMFIHRKDRIGFSTDVLRNVSASASKMSMQLARLKYAPMLRNSVSAAYDAVANNSNLSPFAKEAERRVNLALAGNAQEDLGDAVAGVANKASYFWFLSSAASALIQPASVYIAALPVIGANHNDMLGAAKELGKMVTLLNQYSIIKKHPDGTTSIVAPSLTNSDSLNNREKSAVNEMFQRGVTQSTYTGLVWGYKNLPTKSASTVLGKATELGKEAGDLLVGALMHNTERLTREATFLASYRVGFKNYVKKGMSEAAAHEAAINQAVSDVNESLANYDLSNRPRWMQKGLGRVAFQFKMFPLHTALLLTTNFFKMLPVLNKEGKAAAAKKFFGIYLTAGSLAGASGIPAFSPIVAILAAALKKMQDDDEDELPDELKDIDPETWFRTVFLPDLLGDVSIGGVPLSEIADTGLWNALTGLAISERIGLNDMFGRDTKEAKTSRESLSNWALEKAGPTVSLGLSLADAYDAYQLGDFQKAAEKATPAVFRNLIVAERIASEGIKDSKGNEIIPPDKAKAYAIAQAVGFRSAELARISETNFKLTAAEQKIVNERDLLVGRMKVQARKGSDEGALKLEKIFETEVARFNRKNPEYAIDPDTLVDTLVKDLETRASARLGFTVTEKNARLVDPTLYHMEQRLERLRDKQ